MLPALVALGNLDFPRAPHASVWRLLRENGPCFFGLLVSLEKYEKLNSSRTATVSLLDVVFLHDTSAGAA